MNLAWDLKDPKDPVCPHKLEKHAVVWWIEATSRASRPHLGRPRAQTVEDFVAAKTREEMNKKNRERKRRDGAHAKPERHGAQVQTEEASGTVGATSTRFLHISSSHLCLIPLFPSLPPLTPDNACSPFPVQLKQREDSRRLSFTRCQKVTLIRMHEQNLWNRINSFMQSCPGTQWGKSDGEKLILHKMSYEMRWSSLNVSADASQVEKLCFKLRKLLCLIQRATVWTVDEKKMHLKENHVQQ